ncbi:MAG: four helix bundle protein [Elusimicrobia bacterium]|nr:four helix bundle protein [Elusimicrobiota bacterium]
MKNSKSQILNSKQAQKPKQYDLEDRTFAFAQRVNRYANNLSKTISNIENATQLVRAGGSVGANYIEANESLGKKDFLMIIRICRKEAKESRYWLRLAVPEKEFVNEKELLIQEALELTKIFGSILEKSK